MLKPTTPFVIIAAVCILAIAPFFWMGTPSGHDLEFHLNSWIEVESQWEQGILYPRWTSLANWGYGEPTFLFYPPASWILGALLGSLLPWKMVPGTFCWLALVLAGSAMYALARRWLSSAEALFAACFYAINPYFILVIYWRSAYAELLASALVPLLLLCLLQLNDSSLRPALWLGLTLAAAWFTNIPAAIMIHYSAAFFVLLLAIRNRSLRPLLRFTFAVLFGAALASVYLVPALYEQRWVSIGQILSPGVRPEDNFLFTASTDPDHNHFNLLISLVAASEIAMLAAAILLSRKQRKTQHWPPLVLWGAAVSALMFPFTHLLWKYLPKFRFVQLPFRWLLCLNTALALVLAMAESRSAFRRWLLGGLAYVTLLGVLVFAALHTQIPWWDSAADIEEMRQSIADGSGYEGVYEYVPPAADPSELNKELPRLSEQLPSDEAAPQSASDSGAAVLPAIPLPNAHLSNAHLASATILRWSPTEKHFRIVLEHPADVTLRLINYPAWRATVNGRNVPTMTSDVTGLLIVPLLAGPNDVDISFTSTADRKLGAALSLLALVAIAAACMKTRPQPPSNPTS